MKTLFYALCLVLAIIFAAAVCCPDQGCADDKPIIEFTTCATLTIVSPHKATKCFVIVVAAKIAEASGIDTFIEICVCNALEFLEKLLRSVGMRS